MSAADRAHGTATPLRRGPSARLLYGSIVIIGGGCYGSYYARQLRRARGAGAIEWDEIIIVDRDPACQVVRELGARAGTGTEDAMRVVCADWASFLDGYLSAASAREHASDAIVPSPLMPHLLFEWLLARARRRWPARDVRRVALERAPSVPWERGSTDGTHYVSFAEWMCPINCIEPPMCPEIRGPRTWSLPPAVRAYVRSEVARGRPLVGPLVLHCTHRAYGVGMIDVADVVDADRAVEEAGTRGPARVLVGTMSHCHGALDVLAVGGVARPR